MKIVENSFFVLVVTENDSKKYSFDILNQERFTQVFLQFMSELGFGDKALIKLYHNPYKNIPLKTSSIKDEDYEIYLFYGDSQIILVARPKTKIAGRKFIRVIEKYRIWEKFSEKYNII